MAPSPSRPFKGSTNIPIVAAACLVFFMIYLLLTTGSQTLRCQQQPAAPAQCEAVRTILFGLVSYTSGPFAVSTVEVNSELTDRVPRGGVRFHHQLIFRGAQGQFTADLKQSPLAGIAVKKQVQDFLVGNGSRQLTFRHRPLLALVRTGLMAFLLSIVAWGFWDVRWPRQTVPQPYPEEVLPK